MIETYWRYVKAKSDGTTLLEHTLAVMDRGMELIQTLSLNDEQQQQLQDKFLVAAALHDLGKIHPFFQARLKGDKQVDIRHELVSLWFALTYLEVDRDVLFALATHHRNLEGTACRGLNIYDLIGFNRIYEGADETMTIEVLQSWIQQFSLRIPFKRQIEEEAFLDREFIRILMKRTQQKYATLLERKTFSLLRALLQTADHIASSGVVDIPKYKPISLRDFQPRKADQLFPFRHFQQMMQSWKGDVVLHAPTGSGKTEAALSWVYANQNGNSRLIYLLPYTASINAMVGRLQQVYGRGCVIAQHSKSLSFLYDEILHEIANEEKDYEYIEAEARKRNSLTREIYYPIKVTTLHQILRTSLRGKGWEFALLEYKNALFIVDEFHAYNAFLTGMMIATVKMIKTILGAKFMFMSATIPDFLLQKIIDEVYDGDMGKLVRPDIYNESDAAVMNRKRHHLLCCSRENIYSAITMIEACLEDGKTVLIIVNNVSTCQEIYNLIHFEGKKRMLHGGFHLASRKEIEFEITHADVSLRPQLLIATQAVEVSLDIDYSVAFIENAPIDSLIQRFGRVNRAGKLCDENGNKTMASIYLYEQIVGKTPFYPQEILDSTWSHLSTLHGCDLSEADLVQVCNRVYECGYSGRQNENFEHGLTNSIITSFEEDWIAGDCNDWIEEVLEKNMQKIDVLCYNLYEKYVKLIKEKRYIEANQLLVSVYPYVKQLPTKIGDDQVIVAKELYYDNEVGSIMKAPDVYEII